MALGDSAPVTPLAFFQSSSEHLGTPGGLSARGLALVLVPCALPRGLVSKYTSFVGATLGSPHPRQTSCLLMFGATPRTSEGQSSSRYLWGWEFYTPPRPSPTCLAPSEVASPVPALSPA